MKTIEWTYKLTKGSVFTAIMILLLSSCATKSAFLTSNVVPAARGSVTVNDDKNENYVIKVKIYNLAEAERLQEVSNTYVVWMETEQNMARNLGQLKSSTKFLSRQLLATFETVSSQKPDKIFVTAEKDPSSQYPSEIILSTDRF